MLYWTGNARVRVRITSIIIMHYQLHVCDQPLHEKCLDFFDAFNKSHSYSMVCHPVGIHNDNFKEGDKSLENKILLSNDNDPGPGNPKLLERGGHLMGNTFVNALLDW